MENIIIEGEKIPNGLVNLYTIKTEDKYGIDTITFSSNVDYDYDELTDFIKGIAAITEERDEFIDTVRDALNLWYTEEYKPIEVKILDHNIRYCPYCGEKIKVLSLSEAFAGCRDCNTKFSTKFEGLIETGITDRDFIKSIKGE